MHYNPTVGMAKILYQRDIDLSKKLDINKYFKPKLRMPNPASFDVADSQPQQKDGM
jgi:hypothetical protein